MKKILLLITALTTMTVAHAQDWFPVGNGLRMTSNNDVNVLLEYNGELIAGGDMEVLHGSDTIIAIGRFDGTGWKQMGPGAGFNQQVHDLEIYNGALYAGGDFVERFNDDGTEFIGGIARWDGTQWQPVSGLGYSDVRALTIYDGKMCAARWEDENMDAQYSYMVSCYDGNTWTDLPGTFRGPNDYVELNDMLEYDGKLAVIGRFDSVADQAINMVALWDGNAWTDPEFPVTGRAEAENGNIIIFGYALTGEVVDGNLMVGGLFPDYGQGIEEAFTLGAYDGSDWTIWSVDTVHQGSNAINDIVVMNDSVFVIGDFYAFDPITSQPWSGALLFDREASQPFTNMNFAPVYETLNGSENAIAGYVWNGSLYVGGDFAHAGSSEANNIARLDPNAVQPTGIDDFDAASRLNIYPNPTATSFAVSGLTIGSRMAIMDAMGRTVSSLVANAERMEVSVGGLSTGIYMVQVVDGNEVRASQLVVN